MKYSNKEKIIKIKNIIKIDKRGGMFKYFNDEIYKKLLINFKVKESQISFNKSKDIFRGFYMQFGKFSEGKLITLLEGKAVWFAVDLRIGSKKFGEVKAFKLSNKFSIFIPRGFAHGSFSLSKSKILILTDNIYNSKKSFGINYKDIDLIYKNFNLKNKKLIISKNHKNFSTMRKNISKYKKFIFNYK